MTLIIARGIRGRLGGLLRERRGAFAPFFYGLVCGFSIWLDIGFNLLGRFVVKLLGVLPRIFTRYIQPNKSFTYTLSLYQW